MTSPRPSLCGARPSSLALPVVLAGLLMGGPASVCAADAPGITPIPLTTAITDEYVYPPEMRGEGSDGKYRETTVFPSTTFPAGRVAFWASKAGVLRTDAYPIDEFVQVIEGQLVTTDRNGTRREFGPGDTFVIPKGWQGEWDMRTDFKKVFVNF